MAKPARTTPKNPAAERGKARAASAIIDDATRRIQSLNAMTQRREQQHEAASMGDHVAAKRTRIKSGNRPQGGSDNWHADPLTRDNVRRDARSLRRNNSDLRAMATRLADLLVGDGMVVRSADEDKTRANRYTGYFKAWAESRKPDRLGVRNLWQMLHAIAQVPVYEGDGLIVKVRDVDGTPQLQWIEGERLINPSNGIDTAAMVGGCEIVAGKIVRYHVAEWAAVGAYTDRKTRGLSAGDVIPVRNLAHDPINRVRSLPAAEAGMDTLQLVDEMEYNSTVAGAMAAAYALIIETQSPGETQAGMEGSTEEQTETSSARPQDIEMRPGMIFHAGKGETVKGVQAEQPNINVPAYTRSMIGKVGADIGIAFTFSHLNLEGMTASNARALLAVQQRILELAHSQIELIIRDVWRFVIGAAIENGELPYSDRFDACDVIPKAPPQVDLNGDIDASVKLRDNLLSSGRREAERLGTGEYASIVAEIGDEKAMEEEAGVARVLKPGAMGAAQSTDGKAQNTDGKAQSTNKASLN